MRAYHDELGSHRATWAGMDDARLAAAYGAYQQSLDEFAADLDGIVRANDAAEAHDEMTVATRALADIYAERAEALASTESAAEDTEDLEAREGSESSTWFAACHDIQDMALVDEIDIDLLCVTMLGSNTEID